MGDVAGLRASFADQLRQRRIAASLTQEELAERSGLSVRAIRDMERGRTTNPRLSTLRHIARALCLDATAQRALAAAARWQRIAPQLTGPGDAAECHDEQLRPTTTMPGPALPAPRELPATAANFTGRSEELATLTELTSQAADEASNAVVISAIGGTAGVGKTALALQWAHRVAENFPDGQLYVNLRGYDTGEPRRAADALASFLRSLGMTGADIPAELDERAARYRSLLAGRRVLVLLDNAISAEQVRPLLPGSPGCVTLVTSRDKLAGLIARDGALRLDLDLLPLADCVRLLRTLIGSRVDDDPHAAALLAGACCRLPLALRVAAELAASRPAARLASLARELTDQRHRLDLLDAGGDARASARAVFSWSYRSLEDSTARAFRLLGLHPGPDFDIYAVAALTGSSAASAGRIVAQLARTGLIQPAGRDRYGMHDLLRAYASELAAARDGETARRCALTRVFDHYLHTAAVAMDILFPAELHRRPRISRPASPAPELTDPGLARDWLDEHRATLTAVTVFTAGNGWPRHTSQLAATLARHLDAARHYLEAVTIHSCARTAARQTGDRVAEATALFSLGLVCTRQGRYQRATEHSELALVLYREARDLTGQARALTNLGNIRVRQGSYAEAVQPFRQALALFQEIGDLTGQAHTLSNLGLIDERLANYQQASQYLQQALNLCRETGDKMGEAYTLASLGCLCRHQHRYQQAAGHLQQALELCRAIDERTCEAHTLADLGLVELRQGHYPEAADRIQQSLALFRNSGDQSGEAEALNSLGEVALCSNSPGDALIQYTAALSLASEIGDQHEQARAHDGLGRAHDAHGSHEKARRHWQRALVLYSALGVPQADRVRVQLAQADR
jgi:tetratricopeptide (TPR) repeat protein/transcriptional regulator with XRE-family HTH domain